LANDKSFAWGHVRLNGDASHINFIAASIGMPNEALAKDDERHKIPIRVLLRGYEMRDN
jgi:hypothetical protein